ncbi:hypothetical protein [Photorhabdus antumapuensis]|nr:hypothetical protein [Photorhabdus antumapuensis]
MNALKQQEYQYKLTDESFKPKKHGFIYPIVLCAFAYFILFLIR